MSMQRDYLCTFNDENGRINRAGLRNNSSGGSKPWVGHTKPKAIWLGTKIPAIFVDHGLAVAINLLQYLMSATSACTGTPVLQYSGIAPHTNNSLRKANTPRTVIISNFKSKKKLQPVLAILQYSGTICQVCNTHRAPQDVTVSCPPRFQRRSQDQYQILLLLLLLAWSLLESRPLVVVVRTPRS